jgi:hypothetical protein
VIPLVSTPLFVVWISSNTSPKPDRDSLFVATGSSRSSRCHTSGRWRRTSSYGDQRGDGYPDICEAYRWGYAPPQCGVEVGCRDLGTDGRFECGRRKDGAHWAVTKPANGENKRTFTCRISCPRSSSPLPDHDIDGPFIAAEHRSSGNTRVRSTTLSDGNHPWYPFVASTPRLRGNNGSSAFPVMVALRLVVREWS